MKSIEMIVPRKLITQFYPHPEYYGDFIVELQNGMVTDVYYREEGDFITITSEEDLIDYLNNQEIIPTKFQLRNGVFAFREIFTDDTQILDLWRNQTPIRTNELLTMKNNLSLESAQIPTKMFFTFYWIEVGIIELSQNENGIQVILDIYELPFIENFTDKGLLTLPDIDICLQMIKKYLTSKLLNS